MGQVSVIATETNGVLSLQYGQMQVLMYPSERRRGEDVYHAETTNQDWLVGPFEIVFQMSPAGDAELVELPFTEGVDVAVFRRDSYTSEAGLPSMQPSYSLIVLFSISALILYA
jgi:hypothetical protein